MVQQNRDITSLAGNRLHDLTELQQHRLLRLEHFPWAEVVQNFSDMQACQLLSALLLAVLKHKRHLAAAVTDDDFGSMQILAI